MRPHAAGSWPRSTPRGTSSPPSRCPTTSTWSAASPCRCRPAATSTGWRSSRARSRASCCRAIPCASGGRASTALALSDLVLGSRSANLVWRRTDAGHRALQSAADVQAERGDAAVLRGRRACGRAALRGAARGAKAGWRRGLFRKIFGGGGAAISLKFDAQAAALVESAHRGLQLETPQAGELRAGGGGDRRQGGTDRAGAALPGGRSE